LDFKFIHEGEPDAELKRSRMTESAQSIKPILLLGAGFSRNWGGWLASEAFEFLLGCKEIRSNAQLKKLLWQHQPRGGFEEALADIQREAARSGPLEDLKVFEAAIAKMFDSMNRGYSGFQSLEFTSSEWAWLHHFLLRFDAIFTLNQDYLLEKLYLAPTGPRVSDRRWTRWHLPGMQTETLKGVEPPNNVIWVPGAIKEVPNSQPIYKLHGSSTWRDPAKGSVMILGANKEASIQSHEILRYYADEFRKRLSEKGARLMVIGYGFRDLHINTVITDAVRKGLQFYVIDPRGSDLARSLNETRQPGALIAAPTELEAIFEQGLIGASRRSLRGIFGGDDVEYAKVMDFFD
jgi:hypothetical protein